MSIEPWINWQFHKAPGLIDPRASFVRASVGRAWNRIGTLAVKPANAARFRFNPISGVCEGLLCEPQRTNLLLRSQELENAAWTATACTVTANSTTAPDNTSTAETLAATGAGGSVAQAVTITAGRGIALSLFAKANASSFLWLQLTDGTNAVQCWFNLAAGTTGSNTAGAGTNLFSQKSIENMGNGWYRCSLEVTTATATAFTASAGPAAADSTAPASADSIFAWGAQLEAEATVTNPTSYIPTTSATVTRSADNLFLPVTSSQVPLDRGTLVFDFVARVLPPSVAGQTAVLGGIGDTFDNCVYISRTGATAIGANYRTGGVGSATITRTCAWTPGTIYRVGLSWTPGRLALCLDGGTLTTTAANVSALASVARIAVGMNPFSAATGSNVSNVLHRAFLYAPVTASDAVLQQLTAP